jgi:hypothetical protein
MGFLDTDIHMHQTNGMSVVDVVAKEGWEGSRRVAFSRGGRRAGDPSYPTRRSAIRRGEMTELDKKEGAN